MKIGIRKALSSFTAFAVAVVCLFSSSAMNFDISADTMSDLQAKQKELANKRKELEDNMSLIEGKADEQEQYIKDYDERMKIQEQEIDVVKEQISILEEDIADLEGEIGETQTELDNGIAQFRKRLRALYMAGNESTLSVIAGSDDFYDMLARMELVQRISEHDNEMIDDLKSLILDLQTQKEELDTNLNELENKKATSEKYLAELQETYNNHRETKAMYEAEYADYMARADEIDEQEAQVEKEMQEFIRKQQEELERKRKEEEERRRQEEERKKKEAEERGETYTPSAENSTPSYTQTGFIWPCPSVRNMSDKYGNRWIVEEQRYNFHKGIDITKPGCGGSEIVASAAGTVIVAANTGNGYGYHVVIDHGNKISTLYGHCSKLAVKAGDEVSQGQVIGYIGSTGYAYGNHLHFEVRVNGQHTDPLKYVSINN